MLREINNNIFKVTVYGSSDRFIETDRLEELFGHIIELESKGALISGVVQILSNGKTPRIAFRGHEEFKRLKKEFDSKK